MINLKQVADKCIGEIKCRFAAGSHNLRDLGDYIRKHQLPHFQPFFLVQEVMCDEAAQHIYITQENIREMTERGLFHLQSIVIPVTSEKAIVTIHLHLKDEQVIRRSQSGFAISGFPRELADGELLKKIRKYTTSLTTFLEKLTALASHPTLPKPERPRLFNKRQSLREKRKGHISPDRPASDSNISYTSQTLQASTQYGAASTEYPEMPSDVPDWISRRNRASRAPPRPTVPLGLQQTPEEGGPSSPSPYEDDAELYELDAGVAIVSGANEDSVPHTVPPNEVRDYYGQQYGMQNEEDAELRALDMSQQEESPALRRMNTGGFDEDEIAEAINRSMQFR